MSNPTQDQEIAAMSYEQARDALVGVVSSLESGGATLADTMILWERGEALADRCQEILDAAATTIAEKTTPQGTTQHTDQA